MEFFRNITKSWYGRAFLGLVLVVFIAFAFLPTLNPPGTHGEVAIVNGEKIESRELDQAVEQAMARFGNQVDRKLLEQLVKRDDVLDNLIRERVVIGAAREAGLVVNPDELRDTIRGIPAFQDESGKFSQQKFESVIARNGIAGVNAFRELVEKDLLTQQLDNGIQQTSFATRQDLDLLSRIVDQARDVAWVTLSPEPLVASMSVTDDEVGKKYDANTTGYMTDERYSVEYLEVSALALGAGVSIDEADIRAAYDELVAKASKNAERRVAHIFVAVNAQRDEKAAAARAQEALDHLAKGEAFPKVADQYSDDPSGAAHGGDLGYLGHGVLQPEQEQALFALGQNDVSSPVRSKDGFHLFKVLDIRAVDVPSFEKARDGVLAGLRHDKGLEKYRSAIDELSNAAYEADNLQDPAQKVGLKVQASDVFSSKGGAGIANYPKIVAAVQSPEVLEDGRNSGVIEVEDGHAYVIHLKEHFPPKRRPLAEVAGEIRKEIQREKAIAEAKRRGDAIMKAVAGGQSIEAAATGLPIKRQAALKRRGMAAEVPAEVMTAAFRAKRPAAGAKSLEADDTADGSHLVVAVSNVVDGSLLGMSPDVAAGGRVELATAYGRIDLGNVVAAATVKADVKKLHEPKPGEESPGFKFLGKLGRPGLPQN